MLLARIITDVEPGGAQLHVLRLTRALREHGIESRVLAAHASPEGVALFARGGVELEVLGTAQRRQYVPDAAFAAWLAPRIEDVDVVHAHMFGGWWAAGRVVPEELRFVASEHNPVRWPGKPRLAELRRGLARVDLFFAHGSQAAATVLAAGLPADRLRPGISPVAGLDARPRPGLPVPRIVFAGRLHPEKGPDVLLDAVARMADPPPVLVLGTGPAEADLRAQATRLGLEHVVRFVGWQDNAAVWVAGASVFAQPSRDEAWSQSAVVAMGLGVPVVGTDVDDLPLTLGEGRGIVVPNEDPAALAAALEDVLAGRRMPDLRGARAYARRFEVEAVAAHYARAYAELAAQAEPGREPAPA
ncbi:MAG: glycosyltransferase family 4 protein [Solirubrobacterales bacterium]|nr:glycosyltransferase family 4 protein [Solirubrobacterales bacterium]